MDAYDFSELPIPSERRASGVQDLDRIEALEAQVLALQMLVQSLIEVRAGQADDIEKHVNSECAALLRRSMQVENRVNLADQVVEAAENLAAQVIERAGYEKQMREAN